MTKPLHSKPEEPKRETITKAAPPEPKETVNQRLLRILKDTRERLRSQGVPELDSELDELIAEVEKW